MTNPYLYYILAQDAATGDHYEYHQVEGETIDECLASVRAVFDSPDDCVFLEIRLKDHDDVQYASNLQYAKRLRTPNSAAAAAVYAAFSETDKSWPVCKCGRIAQDHPHQKCVCYRPTQPLTPLQSALLVIDGDA